MQKSLARCTLAVILDCEVFYSSALWLSKQRRYSEYVIIASNLNSQQVTTKKITIFAVRDKITLQTITTFDWLPALAE